jgi:putative ATP-binding cassette transporter
MNLTTFLARQGLTRILWAIGLGTAGGLANAGLVAIVGTALGRGKGAGGAILLLFASAAVVGLVLRLASQRMLVRMAHASMRELRLSLSRRIVSTPLPRLERLGGSRLLAALTEDATAIAEGVQAFPFWCVNLATVVGCFGYLAWLSPAASVGVLLTLSGGVFVYRAIEGRGLVRMAASREQHDRLVEQFRALTDGAKELQMHRDRREKYLSDSLGPIACAVERESVASMTAFAWGGAWAQCVVVALLGVALVWPIGMTNSGDEGVRASYCIAILYLLRPIDFVLQLWPLLRRAGVSLEKLSALELADETASAPLRSLAPLEALEIVGVCYVYGAGERDEPFRLGPIDLCLRPGEVVFLTGGNGSGKSTLGKILTGLYRSEGGEIRWNGRRLLDDEMPAYSESFGVVFADFFLFDRIATPSDASFQRWDALVRRFGLDGLVVREGDLVRTDGLSHGQRRRLALVHALTDDRPIYVFDEWAADQDPHFRRIFYTDVLADLKRQGKLVVAITHDDRYFSVADRVLKLEEGQVVGG